MGVLSALPIISAGNVCCCLWVVSGGLVAAYLLQQNQPAPITAADGALVGLLAGLIGALVAFVVSIPVSILVAPMERAMAERALAMAGTMPPEVREMLEQYGQGQSNPGFVGMAILRLVGLFIFLIVGSIFSTLGGLLGAAIFAKKAPIQ
jgi:hypothetical protein